MKSSLTAIMALSFAAQAGAATLQIEDSTAGFGRIGGVYVTFSSTLTPTAEANWSGTPPVNGQTYSIDSISLDKNNGAGSGLGELWIGVYGSYTGTTSSAGVFGDFLGVSSSSVAWSTFTTGDSVTWTFDNLFAQAAPDQTLFFAFQTSAASLEGQAPIIATEGQTSVRRLPGDGNTIANQGAGIIEALLAVPAGSEGYLRDNRVPLINLQTTQVPEPSAAALFGLGALGWAFGPRRRRQA